MCGMVDAEPVRRHIMALQARGFSLSGIGTAAGVSAELVKYAARTAKRTHRKTAAKILAVREPAGLVDGTGTRRRLQALAALGWTFSDLAARLGYTRAVVHHWTQHETVTVATAAAARRLYDELWNQQAPPGMATTRNRNLAARKGWPPPMAWDDDLIDNPTATPQEWRRPAHARWSPDDLVEAAELGASLASLTQRFNIGAAGVEKALARAGRRDLWRRIVPRERQAA